MGQCQLSVLIITKNEAHNIKACLESVQFADEIIVFDSGSNDGTPDICQQYGAKITVTGDWPGYGLQKARAYAQARGTWILCIDADERLSPALQQEIQLAIKDTRYSAYQLPFVSSYCGQKIYFGDWYKEQHMRLFKRQQYHFSKAIVHEDLVYIGNPCPEKIGQCTAPIYHFPFPHIDSVLKKLNQYSASGAAQKYQQGKRASLWTAISHGIWTFIRGYFIRLGFLDGRAGFMLAVSNAEGTYYRYLKLMWLHEQNQVQSTPKT
jgi:glycosyltransferase involved in cell wall biosynthesis